MKARNRYHVRLIDPLTGATITEEVLGDHATAIKWCADNFRNGNGNTTMNELPPESGVWAEIVKPCFWIVVFIIGIIIIAKQPGGSWWQFAAGICIAAGLNGYIRAIVRQEIRPSNKRTLSITHIPSSNETE